MEKTLRNLAKGFLSECQARTRYTMYAKRAKRDGFMQISQMFAETAEQEKEQAEIFWKMFLEVKGNDAMQMGPFTIEEFDSYMRIGNTFDNLKYAIELELQEYETTYEQYTKDAVGEGYPNIAAKLKAISLAEKHHAERFEKVYKHLCSHGLRNRANDVDRICIKCGFDVRAKYPPADCPACGRDEEYFMVKSENY